MKKITTQGFSKLVLLLLLAIVGVTLATIYSLSNNPEPVVKVDSITEKTEMAGSEDVSDSENLVPGEPTNSVQEEIKTPAIVSGSNKLEVITLAGGCFWCIEAFLQEAPGVVDAVSGYAGGSEEDATYIKVSKGKTSHREAVQVTYDPSQISTEEVLDVFWSSINPTDAGGQFADRGFHYTTAIYFHSAEQQAVAIKSKEALAASGLFDKPIATLILPLTTFFVAEDYHQDYYKKSSEHYELYKKGSGRAGFIDDNWAKDAAIEFLSGEGG